MPSYGQLSPTGQWKMERKSDPSKSSPPYHQHHATWRRPSLHQSGSIYWDPPTMRRLWQWGAQWLPPATIGMSIHIAETCVKVEERSQDEQRGWIIQWAHTGLT